MEGIGVGGEAQEAVGSEYVCIVSGYRMINNARAQAQERGREKTLQKSNHSYTFFPPLLH